MKTFSILFLFSFCTALALNGQVSTNEIRSVPIGEILGNRKEFQGKRILVEGYYKSAFEQSAIYESKEDARSVRDRRSLWIDHTKPGHEGKVHWIGEGRVRLIGTFDHNPKLGSGHLNMWPGRIRDIELFEAIIR